MLFDVRTYITHPGKLQKQLALYKEKGFATQCKHLGKPFAFLMPETGNVNAFTHIWCYKDAADREQRRAEMKADPAWIEYIQLTADAAYYQHQENHLMHDSPFMSL